MVDFVVDKGLNVLLAQINEQAPNRSKASDGSIGDPAHASRNSDHNPEKTRDSSDGNDPNDQVDARDFTHDPARNADMGEISEAIRISRDRRVQYVIFNGRIFSSYASGGVPAWTWRPYTGSDKHRGHMHVSVVDAPNDYTAPWSINMALSAQDLLDIQAAVVRGIHEALDIAANRSNPTGRQIGDDITTLLSPIKSETAAIKLDTTAILANPSVPGEVDVQEVAEAVADELAERLTS